MYSNDSGATQHDVGLMFVIFFQKLGSKDFRSDMDVGSFGRGSRLTAVKNVIVVNRKKT